eukprot:gene4825-9621_t
MKIYDLLPKIVELKISLEQIGYTTILFAILCKVIWTTASTWHKRKVERRFGSCAGKFEYPRNPCMSCYDSSTQKGVKVIDRFRYLEWNDYSRKCWLESQIKSTKKYFSNLSSTKMKFLEKYTDLFLNDQRSLPFQKGRHYFYFRKKNSLEVPVLYKTSTVDKDGEIIFDPNSFNEGMSKNLHNIWVSNDGKLFAYATYSTGSEWITIKIKNSSTLKDLNDVIYHCKKSTSLVWSHENEETESQYESQYEIKNVNHSEYYKHIISNQIITLPEDKFSLLETVSVTSNSLLILKYLRNNNSSHELYIFDVITLKQSIIPLYTEPHCTISQISSNSESGEIFFRVHSFEEPGMTMLGFIGRGAHRGIEVELEVLDCWEHTVSNDNSSSTTNDDLNTSHVRVRVVLPCPSHCCNNNDVDVDVDYFLFTQSHKHKPISSPKPRPRPCILFCYGGLFGIKTTPMFSLSKYIFVQNFDGICCTVGVHRNTKNRQKHGHESGLDLQQSVDDIIVVAEHLIATGVTTSSQLALHSGGHGALLAAICINQRPELFGAAVLQSGIFDMLRYPLLGAGHAWISEYGDPDQKDGSLASFETIRNISPLHNVGQMSSSSMSSSSSSSSCYPAMLLTTVENDEIITPIHSYKFIATLQNDIGSNNKQEKPLLIRVDKTVSHQLQLQLSAADVTPERKVLEEQADIYVFIANNIGAGLVGRIN